MIKIYTIAALSVFLCLNATFAQDTCKTYSHKNPHGSPMTVSRVWVLDSANFRVRPIQQLPYQEAATGSFEFEVCILARDGKKYSTQVRYMTTHGAVSYTISNFQAPGVASAVEQDRDFDHRIYPNPARNSLTIQGVAGSNWVIYDLGGVARLSGVTAAAIESVNVTSLLPGSYFVKVNSMAGVEETQQLIIQ